MNETQDLRRSIIALNDNQTASFGEFLFARLRQDNGDEVASMRSKGELTDFLINGKRIDVKTTRTKIDLDNASYPFKKTAMGVACATVVFLKNKIIVNSQDGWSHEINYPDAETYWQDWKLGHKIRINGSKLRKEREEIKSQIKKRLETAIGVKIHPIIRGMEILPRNESKNTGSKFTRKAENPGNLAYAVMKKDEKIVVYVRFKECSTEYSDGAALSVKELKQAYDAAIKAGAKPSPDYHFDKPPLLPLEYSWGTEKLKNTLMVSIEQVRRNQNKYPQVLFSSKSMQEFENKIIEWHTLQKRTTHD